MKNLRKWTAWLGAGAVIVTLGAGCADRNNNGQPESLATTEETANTVKEGVDATENAADKTGAAATNAANNAAAETAEAGRAAANTADKAGDAVANAADNAGDAVAKAADNAADAVTAAGAAATITPKVKTAIGANAALRGTTIDVDTLADKKTVALRGTVKTAAQKNVAAAVAKREAPADFKIDNQLKVQG